MLLSDILTYFMYHCFWEFQFERERNKELSFGWELLMGRIKEEGGEY